MGDSYSYGHGCKDRLYYIDPLTKKLVGDKTEPKWKTPSEFCWGNLLQKDFSDIEVINLSLQGNSSQSYFRQLTSYLNNNGGPTKNDMIFYYGTLPNRIEIAKEPPHNDRIVPWQLANDWDPSIKTTGPYHAAKKQYVTFLHHKEICANLVFMSLLACYGYAASNSMQFRWTLPILFYDEKLLKFVCRNIMPFNLPSMTDQDYSGNLDTEFNQSCFFVDNHANEKGHELYYKQVILPAVQSSL